MKFTKIRRLRRGLTMVELMLAMVVLFITGVFVMNMFVTGSQQMVKAAEREELSTIARAKVSEVRLVEFVDLDTMSTSGNFPAPDDVYSFDISYSPFEGFPQSEVRRVTVEVSHPENGSVQTRLVRSRVPALEPGQEAFNKFACASCHSLSAAGYAPAPILVPLDQIGDAGTPRPYQTGSGTFSDYIVSSLIDPGGFDPYPNGGGLEYSDLTMTDYQVEGHDAGFDADTDVSAQEMTDMATWLESFDTP